MEQFDFDSKSSYSPVRTALLTSKGDLVINVFPNPATQSLQIQLEGGNPNDSYRIQVFNLLGQLVTNSNTNLRPGVLHTLNLENCVAGTYMLRIISNERENNVEILPFVKM